MLAEQRCRPAVNGWTIRHAPKPERYFDAPDYGMVDYLEKTARIEVQTLVANSGTAATDAEGFPVAPTAAMRGAGGTGTAGFAVDTGAALENGVSASTTSCRLMP